MEERAAAVGSSEEPAQPGTVPAQKQGETARQQIRKAKKLSRRRLSAEEKIRIVIEGIRGELAVSELCRREGIQSTVYYR